MNFAKNKPDKKRYIVQSIVAAGVIAAILVFDLVTKYITSTRIGIGERIQIIPNFFYFTYVQNRGGAWSLGDDNPFLMNVIKVLTVFFVLGVLFVLFFPDKRKNLYLIFSLSLLSSGATGNFVDRVWLGYVRDFISFYIFSYKFPVFNIADIALVTGVIMLIVSIIIYFVKTEIKQRRAKKEARKNAETSDADDCSDDESRDGKDGGEDK